MHYRTAYIALGSNLGDRKAHITRAIEMLTGTAGIDNLRSSSLIETRPLDKSDQPDFLNCTVELQTTLDAKTLFQRLTSIELDLHRHRSHKWAPRTIDLDLLLYGDEIIRTDSLTVPHSQMHLRSFVLKGLVELNPNLLHPVLKVSVSELLERLNGCDFIPKPDQPQLVCIAGLIGVGKTTLATHLGQKLNSTVLLEPYDTNPFLPAVYAGRKELALHSQLHFLFSRTEQLSKTNLKNNTGRLVFTDYIFQKELIYAKLLLDNHQLSEYQKLYPTSLQVIYDPVLVIYLKDSIENCLERIHRRNRYYEQSIEPDFLTSLDIEYNKLFDNWTLCPVIELSMKNFDYNRDSDIENLITQIKAYTMQTL